MFRLLFNGEEPNRDDETEIRKQLKSLYKDEVLEVALQYRFIANGLKNELEQLKQQLAEKDKEIKELKEEISEWVGNKFVKLQYQKAIQELEKVKVDLRAKLHLLESGYLRHFVAWRDICDQINKQIKELEGAKNEN